ncbi:conserved hypothetical protein [Oleispira antarctica RB-8]|uniref:Uncharacterized protein n=1 Tax=Oleispira antarctica RB-8 TaxID=698738 RepID=R4YM78_OLEAN|nr:conserved hypothetical protein [Oleispira antarctica RB-8]
MEGFEIKDYSAIVSGLITALSTLAAVLITNHFHLKASKQNSSIEHQRDISQRKLEKIEEFYLLFEKWETNTSNIYLYHLRVYTGEITYKQVLEATNKKDNYLPNDVQKLKMLLNIHIPELVSEYEKVDAARSKVVPYIINSPNQNKLNTQDFILIQKHFDSTCKAFKAKLCELANEL